MAFASTINLTIITMMIIIYLNEMRNISMFIFNFNYIKDLARITMDEKCNGIYCEAETDRYQIAKNSYNLLMPNDVFNSKTYTIFVFIISIMIFIYYYRMMVDFKSNSNVKWGFNDDTYIKLYSITITVLFIIILIIMIAARYAPNDEQGYINYFKNLKIIDKGGNVHSISIGFVVFIISCIIIFSVIMKGYPYYYSTINFTDLIFEFIKIICFFISITLVFNLMNIVMCFRTNTTPILKTKPLNYSITNSLYNNLDYRIKEKDIDSKKIKKEYEAVKNHIMDGSNNRKTLQSNISSILDIYIAFEELLKITFLEFTHADDYLNKLKKTIEMTKIEKTENDTSNLSLIFDKEVSIPNYYGDEGKDPYFSSSHDVNSNDRNTSYEYTADISYGNANVFYEKYWDMKNIDNPDGNFLDRYYYFVPSNLNIFKGANLYRFMVDVLIFTIIFVFLFIVFCGYLYSTDNNNRDYIYILSTNLFEILFPLIAFVVFVIYIIVFIRFNTNFNKNVVYKCLDCSYKRSLNKLNTIVSPYILMYDKKIIRGNKDYKHHYIIANVFYSILSGNINLSPNSFTPINDNVDQTSYFTISNGLKEVDINTINNLNNENQFREYYKERFKNLYKTKYDDKEVTNIYTVFTNLFGTTTTDKTTEVLIDSYFNPNIIKYDIILKIYRIIKICIKLFDEKTFNNSDKDNYKDFIFYKKSSKLIPHKFILKLTSNTKYEEFVNIHDSGKTYIYEFNNAFDELGINNKIKIKVDTDHTKNSNVDMTSILKDIDNEDSTNQNPDIQNKNMIKIIAKYLLIMGHMNYNGFNYRVAGITDITKKNIYTLQTLNLYELISNVSYVDTFDIDDTFGVKITTAQYDKYKKLTYMYNYLDTKYVILSSNNNKNYLLNIIKSINNTLNNDNKTTQPDNFKDIKEAQYLFRDKINDIAPELPYENEDEILNKAHYISTTSFESTYFINMFIIISYIIGTIVFKIK